MKYKFKEVILNQEELEERLEYWQDMLGLDAWHITVSLKQAHEIANESMGQNHISTYSHVSHIGVVTAETYNPKNNTPLDMELVLLHEMSHLILSDWSDEVYNEKREGSWIKELEIATWNIAKSLLAVERKEQ